MSTSRGAFDLSSLAGGDAPAQSTAGAGAPVGGQEPAPSGAPNASAQIPFKVEVTQGNIQELVANSRFLPVLIVCTSERSPASGELLESIEGLGRENGGRFQIGHVDADTHPEFIQAFGARGVPAVIAILQGQIAPLFEGVPPKNEVVMVLNQVLEAAAQGGMTARASLEGGEVAAPAMPPHHKAGVDALETGDLVRARAEFETALKENPGDDFAKSSLARVAMLERLDTLDISAVLAGGEALEVSDVSGRMEYADALLGAGYVKECFDVLIATVSAVSGDDREAVRKRLVELFDTVGADDTRVLDARRALASALF
ncbi:MAG: tetratricopeptide repeat protein [Actinomycetaceae bacterium]|nr:tetratricopeptide repeat protein [Actinomycetaceae bacterium]